MGNRLKHHDTVALSPTDYMPFPLYYLDSRYNISMIASVLYTLYKDITVVSHNKMVVRIEDEEDFALNLDKDKNRYYVAKNELKELGLLHEMLVGKSHIFILNDISTIAKEVN